MSIEPSQVYALIVGIEKYQKFPDLSGPANDALKFAEWLLNQGVDSAHICLFLSPLDQNQEKVLAKAKSLRLEPQAASFLLIDETIRFLTSETNPGGDLLYVFWGGHGFITKTDSTVHRLFFADTNDINKRNLNVNSLVEALSTFAHGAGFNQQIFFIDACANPIYQELAETMQAESGEVWFAASGDGSTGNLGEQFVFFASAPYEIAINQSDIGTGSFSRMVLEELQGQPLLPDMLAVAERVKEKLLLLQATKPVYWWRKFQGNQEESNPDQFLQRLHRNRQTGSSERSAKNVMYVTGEAQGLQVNDPSQPVIQVQGNPVFNFGTTPPQHSLQSSGREQTKISPEKSLIDFSPACKNNDRKGDVIFVHGLAGDARTTWKHEGNPDSWLDWLAGENLKIKVWSLGYSISSLPWQSENSQLLACASTLLERLRNKGIGNHPLIFVAHDLGGFLVKQMLSIAWSGANEEWKEIADKTKGIVFLSAPNTSSEKDLNEWSTYSKQTLEKLKINIDERCFENYCKTLASLNRSYWNSSEAKKIQHFMYYPSKLINGIYVVNETVASPGTGISNLFPIENVDHVSICRIHAKEADIYRKLERLIRNSFSTLLQRRKDGFLVLDGQVSIPDSIPEQEYDDSDPTNIKAWKEVHSISEDLYRKFREFRVLVIRHEVALQNQYANANPDATVSVAELEYKINAILSDKQAQEMIKGIKNLPDSVKQTEYVTIMSTFLVCCNAIKQNLDLDFQFVQDLTDTIEEWLIETLHIADQVLKKHFDKEQRIAENSKTSNVNPVKRLFQVVKSYGTPNNQTASR